jgi:hypothetical protein
VSFLRLSEDGVRDSLALEPRAEHVELPLERGVAYPDTIPFIRRKMSDTERKGTRSRQRAAKRVPIILRMISSRAKVVVDPITNRFVDQIKDVRLNISIQFRVPDVSAFPYHHNVGSKEKTRREHSSLSCT